MQIYDIIRGLEAVEELSDMPRKYTTLRASGEAAFWSAYASLFYDQLNSIALEGTPKNNREAPDLLNVSRFVEFADVLKFAEQRVKD